jgi:hypothetical protein
MPKNHRWIAQNATIMEFANQLERTRGTVEIDRRETIISLLWSLSKFSENLVEFFEDGFAPRIYDYNLEYKLKPSPSEPAEFVFEQFNRQVLYDLDVIMRAYNQRSGQTSIGGGGSTYAASDTSSPGFPLTNELRNALRFADRLAYSALAPAICSGETLPATVLTYFQKSTQIRLIPYARVALIGIPYSVLKHSFDYLAVAHEVGHYVYRNHRGLQGEFDGFIQTAGMSSGELESWYAPWHEELFADVYGCMIAGPLIALSFQEMAEADYGDVFGESDGQHPTSVLRPYIYVDALAAQAQWWKVGSGDISSAISDLKQRWDEKLRGVSEVSLPRQPRMRIEEARDHLKKLIEEIILAPSNSGKTSAGLLRMSGTPLIMKAKTSGAPPLVDCIRPWFQKGSWSEMLTNAPAPLQPQDTIWPQLFEDLMQPNMPTGGGEYPATPSSATLDGGAGVTEAEPVLSPPEVILSDDKKRTMLEDAPPNLCYCGGEIKPEPLELGKTGFQLDKKIEEFQNRNEIEPWEWRRILLYGGWTEGGTGHPSRG